MLNKSCAYIPLSNPKKENDLVRTEIEAAFKDFVENGQYIIGQQVCLFESNFAKFCRTEYCVSTANGSDALTIALRSLGCKAKDKIVTVPNAGYYSTAAILAIGAIPIYVDINEQTMSMSVASLEKTLGENKDIKCVIVTHLYGAMVNVDKISDLVSKYGALLLEDCSQSHGAKYKGKYAGTYGHAGVYSFYPTKNLGALGDAGAIITNSDTIYGNAIKLRQYGWEDKYHVEIPGGQNSRMDEIQAAILNVKLPKLDSFNAVRKDVVERYASQRFKNIEVFNIEGESFVAHLAIVRTPYRDRLKQFLISNGIACDIHFPVLDYKQRANFSNNTYCKTAEVTVNEILTIPCHSTLTDDEVTYVIEKLNEFDKTV